MEHRIHHQKSTKKLFNKIFHPGNNKKSTQVSPSSSPPGNHEWVPAYMSASATSYEQEKHVSNRSTPNSPSALITTHYNSFPNRLPSPVYHEKTTDRHTITSRSEEDYRSDGDDNSITGRDSILTSSTGSLGRSGSVQRRYSFSSTHEASRQRLGAAKRAEYQEKMEAFDVLIQRRRCSTLRLALAPGVEGY